jgi:ABC-2 type transport system permease protein
MELTPTLVLDPQNTPFPIPVPRNLGGFMVEEIQMLDYPYFPDLRGEGLGKAPGIASGLGQLTLNWASPLALDAGRQQGRTVTELLRSSPGAWTDPSPAIQPDFSRGPLGFAVGKDRGAKTLGVAVEGRFDSLFAGRPSPLLTADEDADEDASGDAEDEEAGAEAQGEFCLVKVTAENISKEPQYLSTDQTAFDAEGAEFDSDTSAMIWVEGNDGFVLGEKLNPGNSLDGVFVFDIPKGGSLEYFEFKADIFSTGVKIAAK